TICGPNVRFGTKWLSMTSTWAKSAVAMRARSACMFTKSAERMLGLMRGAAGRLIGLLLWVALQQGEEHGVGAVTVRPQLHASGSVAGEVDGALDQIGDDGRGIQLRDVVASAQHLGDDSAGLGEVGRAGRVRDDSARCEGVQRTGEE